MIPPRVICYISTMNLFIAILGFVKTENYWYMPPMLVCLVACIVCSIIEYRRHKDVKAAEVRIAVSRGKDNHYCNVLTSSVVCFERAGELWVKEYSDFKRPEGRTYMVYHCPWCGYQTEKSKSHQKANMWHTMKEKMQ